jgi:hypothetical protein
MDYWAINKVLKRCVPFELYVILKAEKNRYLTGSFNHGSIANAMTTAMVLVFHIPADKYLTFVEI